MPERSRGRALRSNPPRCWFPWLAVVFALPLVLLGALRLGASDSLDALATDSSPVLIAPAERTITDEAPVALLLTLEPGLALYGPPWSGVVATLRPGESLVSGDRVAIVGGIARIALSTPDPFHRSLRSGDSGPDVAQLNRALVALGYLDEEPVPADEFWWPTTQAVRAFAADLGFARPDGVFDPSWVVWLPKEPFVLAEWALEPGAQAPAPGSAIGREPVRVAAATVAPTNQGESLALDAGLDWVVEIEGLILPVDAATRALPAEAAAQLSPLVKADQERMTGRLRRAQPLAGFAVPSTAIQLGSDGRLCAWLSEGAAYRAVTVDVTGARAGVTNIAGGLQPGARVLANPVDVLEDPSCPSP